MRWTLVLTAAAAALASGTPVACAQAAAGNASAPLFSRHAEFSIPFRLDAQAVRTGEIAEIQLYVSDDAGATWRLAGRVEPSATVFPFRASKDGLYWFVLHTVRRGEPVGAPPTDRPGLRVLVDTTPPILRLEAGQKSSGEVWTRWTIEEPNLDPESLLIQYRAGADQPWHTVPLKPETPSGPLRDGVGQTTWWPLASFRRLEIRAEVSDKAGNRAVAHAQIGGSVPEGQTAGGGETSRPAGWHAAETSAEASHADPAVPSAGASGPPSARATSLGRGDPSGEADLPSPSAKTPSVRAFPAAMTLAGQAETDRPKQEPPVAIQLGAPKGASNAAPGSAASAAERDATGSLPPGIRPRMINSRRFELAYDVESVGPSGIGRVELWGTRDGGRSWSSFGVDEDRQSPLLVTVNEEGIFGFRVVVTSGAGLGGDPPKSGDLPDIWIGVDLTKPVCRIVSAEPSPAHPGQLSIRWEATDMALADRPVSLFYGSTADGPWTPIAADLENTGEYAWAADSPVPTKVYLRLEVRDAAGNLAIFESRQPVSLDPLRPSVRIREVRPFH